MQGVRKRLGKLDVVDGSAVLAEEPGVAREGFGIAGDVVNRLRCFKTLEVSLMLVQSSAWRDAPAPSMNTMSLIIQNSFSH